MKWNCHWREHIRSLFHGHKSAFASLLAMASTIAAVTAAIIAYQSEITARQSETIARKSEASALRVEKLIDEQTSAAIYSKLPLFQYSITQRRSYHSIPNDIVVSISNEGYMVAKIASVTIAWTVAEKLPNTPNWKSAKESPIRPEKLVEERSGQSVPSEFKLNLSPEELVAVERRSASLWVYGYFCYHVYYNPWTTNRARMARHEKCVQENNGYDSNLDEYRIAKRFDPDTQTFLDDLAFAKSHDYIEQ